MQKILFSFLFIHIFTLTSSFLNAQDNSDSLAIINRLDSLMNSEPTDTLLLMDGDVIITTIIDTTDGIITYKRPYKYTKLNSMETYDAFSLKNPKGEFILYTPDTNRTDEYTVEEMRFVILGQQEATKNSKFKGPIIANFLIGYGAGLTGHLVSPLVPIFSSWVFSIPKIKVKSDYTSNPEYLTNQAYLDGYKQAARKKRNQNTFLSGGAGLIAGIITHVILSQFDMELLK